MELGNLWRKSSYSGAAGSTSCVELGMSPTLILVRDTTDRDGFTMPVTSDAWRRFTTAVKRS